MPRKKGSRLVNGKVVEPELVAEIADQEQMPRDIKPNPPELATPMKRDFNAKFVHDPLGLKIILWRGDYSKELLLPQNLMKLPGYKVAEETIRILLNEVNKL